MDYMKLLVTELQNQNPLEPLDNQEMAAQLAQFSQLQQLESMSLSFAEVLDVTNRTYANSLIGREVTFLTETETGDLKEMSGMVKEVFNDPKKGSVLVIEAGEDKYTLSLGGIVSVKS
jgi:flagellar basal-body rod modification protein FlgD